MPGLREGRVRNAGLSAALRRLLKEIEQRHQQQADDDPKGEIFTEIIQRLCFPKGGLVLGCILPSRI